MIQLNVVYFVIGINHFSLQEFLPTILTPVKNYKNSFFPFNYLPFFYKYLLKDGIK